MSYSCRGQTSEVGLMGQSRHVSRNVFLLEILGESLFLAFLAFRGCWMPWLMAPSSFKVHRSALFPWSHLLSLTLTTLPPFYEDPGSYIKPTLIIQDILSNARPLTSLHRQFFATATSTSFLPQKVHVQVFWGHVSLEGHYSADCRWRWRQGGA